MSTQSLDVTVVGWIGSEVTLFPAREGRQAYTSFRMGSTRRYFDRATSTWRDGRTEWFRVKVWRTLAVNVAQSLRKGEPIVAHGRLSTEEWTSSDGSVHSGLVLEAVSVGHDLAFGSTMFRRTIATPRADGAVADVTGLVEAPSDEHAVVEQSDEPADGPDGPYLPGHAVGDERDEARESDDDERADELDELDDELDDDELAQLGRSPAGLGALVR